MCNKWILWNMPTRLKKSLLVNKILNNVFFSLHYLNNEKSKGEKQSLILPSVKTGNKTCEEKQHFLLRCYCSNLKLLVLSTKGTKKVTYYSSALAKSGTFLQTWQLCCYHFRCCEFLLHWLIYYQAKHLTIITKG